MSRTNSQTTDTKARGSVAKTKGPTKTNKQPLLPTDVVLPEEEYFANFQGRDVDFNFALPFKDGFDESHWHFHFFNFKQVVDNRALIAADGFVRVTRDGEAYGHKFSDWLDESAFMENGTVSLGGQTIFNRTKGEHIQEHYLYVRPKAAQRARERVEIEHSRKYVDKRTSKDENMKRQDGESKTAIRVEEYFAGEDEDDSQGAWEN